MIAYEIRDENNQWIGTFFCDRYENVGNGSQIGSHVFFVKLAVGEMVVAGLTERFRVIEKDIPLHRPSLWQRIIQWFRVEKSQPDQAPKPGEAKP